MTLLLSEDAKATNILNPSLLLKDWSLVTGVQTEKQKTRFVTSDYLKGS